MPKLSPDELQKRTDSKEYLKLFRSSLCLLNKNDNLDGLINQTNNILLNLKTKTVRTLDVKEFIADLYCFCLKNGKQNLENNDQSLSIVKIIKQLRLHNHYTDTDELSTEKNKLLFNQMLPDDCQDRIPTSKFIKYCSSSLNSCFESKYYETSLLCKNATYNVSNDGSDNQCVKFQKEIRMVLRYLRAMSPCQNAHRLIATVEDAMGYNNIAIERILDVLLKLFNLKWKHIAREPYNRCEGKRLKVSCEDLTENLRCYITHIAENGNVSESLEKEMLIKLSPLEYESLRLLEPFVRKCTKPECSMNFVERHIKEKKVIASQMRCNEYLKLLRASLHVLDTNNNFEEQIQEVESVIESVQNQAVPVERIFDFNVNFLNFCLTLPAIGNGTSSVSISLVKLVEQLELHLIHIDRNRSSSIRVQQLLKKSLVDEPDKMISKHWIVPYIATLRSWFKDNSEPVQLRDYIDDMLVLMSQRNLGTHLSKKKTKHSSVIYTNIGDYLESLQSLLEDLNLEEDYQLLYDLSKNLPEDSTIQNAKIPRKTVCQTIGYMVSIMGAFKTVKALKPTKHEVPLLQLTQILLFPLSNLLDHSSITDEKLEEVSMKVLDRNAIDFNIDYQAIKEHSPLQMIPIDFLDLVVSAGMATFMEFAE